MKITGFSVKKIFEKFIKKYLTFICGYGILIMSKDRNRKNCWGKKNEH